MHRGVLFRVLASKLWADGEPAGNRLGALGSEALEVERPFHAAFREANAPCVTQPCENCGSTRSTLPRRSSASGVHCAMSDLDTPSPTSPSAVVRDLPVDPGRLVRG